MRGRLQRHIASGTVLEAEAVGDQAIARFAPQVVPVEFRGKAVVESGVVNASRALALVSLRDGGIGEIEEEKEPQTIEKHRCVGSDLPRRERHFEEMQNW